MDHEAMSIGKVIRAGGVNEHFNLPWIKCSEQIDASGFRLEWKAYPGGTGVLTEALRSHEIDIAVLLTEGLILDILKKGKIKLICFHVNNPLRWAIHVRENDSTSGVSYQNKRFAVSRLGSGSHTMARFLLYENKAPYEPENMIEVGSLEGGLEAVQQQRADIFLWEKYTTEPFLKDYQLKAIGEIKTPWPPFSVAVSEKFYAGNSDFVYQVIGKVRALSAKILKDPESPAEMGRRWKISHENALRWLSEIQWNDQTPLLPKDVAPVLENMKKVGLLEVHEQPDIKQICV